MTPARERESRAGIYDVLGFARYATTRADQLSGGTLAKLNLGLALLADPEVLLLDEPYVESRKDNNDAIVHVTVRNRAELA